MWKNRTDESISREGVETDIENKPVGTAGEGEARTN